MERGQQRAREARVPRLATPTVGAVHRAPDGGHAVHPRAVQVAPVQRRHVRHRRPRRLHTGREGTGLRCPGECV